PPRQQQTLWRIQPVGSTVDLDGLTVLFARLEDGSGVELTLGAPAAASVGPIAAFGVALAAGGEPAPGAVAEDVQVGVGDRPQHPPGHAVRLVSQTTVDRADDDIERGEQVV